MQPSFSNAINAGAGYFKTQGPGDPVAATGAITVPYQTAEGITGLVSPGAPSKLEEYITIIIDATDETEGTSGIAKLFDGNEMHSCETCPGGGPYANIIIGDASCNKYTAFLNKLCQSPYQFAAMRVEMTQSSGVPSLPNIRWSRMNLNGDSNNGTIFLTPNVDYTNNMPSNFNFADTGLNSNEGRIDNDTQWSVPISAGQRITLTLKPVGRGAY